MSHLNKILIAMVGVVLLGASSALAQVQFSTGGSFTNVRGEGATENVGQVSLLATNAGTITAGSAITITYSAPITEFANAGVACIGTCTGFGATTFSVSGQTLTMNFVGAVTFAINDQINVSQIRVNASSNAVNGGQIGAVPSAVSSAPTTNPITFNPAFSNIVVGVVSLPSSVVSISSTSTTSTPIGVPLGVFTCAPPAGALPVGTNFSFQVKKNIPNAWTTLLQETTNSPSYVAGGSAVAGATPTQGSWITVTLTGVPAGFTVQATSTASKTTNSSLSLLAAGNVAAPAGTALVPVGIIVNGVGAPTAGSAVGQTVAGTPIVFTYFFSAASLAELDTETLGYSISATPSATTVAPGGLTGPVTATVAYGPLQPSPAPAVNSLPDIRFATNTIGTLTVANVSDCITRLLHPWVLGGNGGYDTGIAIANTSLDAPAFTAPNVAIPQNGTCTLTGFPFTGNGAAAGTPVQTTIASVAAGNQWANNVSNVTGFSGFRGALLVVCNFLNAHDFVFITNGFGSLTGPSLAEGYLGLVVPNVPRTIAGGEVLGE